VREVTRITEAKGSPKGQKKNNNLEIQGKFNDKNSADENK
jgi:hypothetical protein